MIQIHPATVIVNMTPILITSLVALNALLVACKVLYSTEVVTYVESLILNMAEQRSGAFNCWFLKFSSDPTQETALDAIATSQSLDMVPRKLLHTAGNLHVAIHPDPSLMVVYCESYKKFYYNLQYFLAVNEFLVSMKVIALHDTSVGDEMIYFVNAFYTTHYYNTVHISVNTLMVSYFLAYRQQYKTLQSVTVDGVFVDQTADLTGITLRISTLHYPSHTRDDLLRDSNTEWVVNTIKSVHGGYILATIDANRSSITTLQNTLYYFTEDIFYDFCLIRTVPLEGQVRPFYLQSSLPYTMAVTAPKGHRLTALEIFLLPFELEVWCTLIALLGMCCAVMMFCPIHFENDLILHPLCGFEKKCLDKVPRMEQFVLISLIMFFFLLTNAFEAKIIALMTSIPSTPDPRTLEDLIRQNITIQHAATADDFFWESESLEAKIFTYDPNDRQFQNRSEIRRNFNRKRGFSGVLGEIKYAINNPDEYDFESDQSRFVILDQFALGIRIAFHFSGYRNPLVPRLERTHRAFFEAGLLDFWDRRKIQYSFGVMHLNRVSASLQQKIANRRDLGMLELELAWYVLAIGSGLAGLVFALEHGMILLLTLKKTALHSKRRG